MEAKDLKKTRKKCPHCGANMMIHGHRLSKGLVNSLVKLKNAVLENQRNEIHLQKEVVLTKNQYNNFQKLRYHGLVAKCVDPETKDHKSGYWLLTKRGNEFCKGLISVPQSVYTFRNKIVGKHQTFLKISEILKDSDLPIWDKKEAFPFEYADIQDIEEIKFDVNGQGLIWD